MVLASESERMVVSTKPIGDPQGEKFSVVFDDTLRVEKALMRVSLLEEPERSIDVSRMRIIPMRRQCSCPRAMHVTSFRHLQQLQAGEQPERRFGRIPCPLVSLIELP